MSYMTLEADIAHGQVIVKEPAKLPVTGKALVTIVDSGVPATAGLRPLEALEALQQHLKLDDRKASEWMRIVREARR